MPKQCLVTVCVGAWLDRTYDYLYTIDAPLSVGAIVQVNFNHKLIFAMALEVKYVENLDSKIKYKAITLVTPFTLDINSVKFIKHFSHYNMLPIGVVYKLFLPPSASLLKTLPSTYIVSGINTSVWQEYLAKIKVKAKHLEALIKVGVPLSILGEYITDNINESDIKNITPQSMTIADFAKALKVTQKEVKDWIEGQALQISIAPNKDIDYLANYKPVVLNQYQKTAYNEIITAQEKYNAVLLDGVPGSGKTEIYFNLIANAMKKQKQVLLMLPEIGLSMQIIARFKERFSIDPLVWNSSVTPASKLKFWRLILNGFHYAPVVIGTRSALTLPYKELGLIIVDEEHDSSYKQVDSKVIYNARDMAVMRGKLCNHPVVLGSATPSLESYYNSLMNKYYRVSIGHKHNLSQFPSVNIINMKNAKLPKGEVLSNDLIDMINHNMSLKHQTLLFINRRGYAGISMCTSCGHRISCINCSVYMVYHLASDCLKCHYCGYSCKKPKACPECEDISFTTIGAGIEKVAQEVKYKVPSARIVEISSDLVQSSNIDEIITSIQQQDVDIIIGTQIIAKGYNFRYLTTTCIVDADIGFYGSDLKASETAFQALYQVAGRAGRFDIPGKVLLQTYQPTHNMIEAIANLDKNLFIQQELEMRKLLDLPPYSRMAGIILSSKDKTLLYNFANYMSSIVPRNTTDYEVLGPVDAVIATIKHKHRVRFLVKSKNKPALQKFIKHWMNKLNTPSLIEVKIDIDPIQFV